MKSGCNSKMKLAFLGGAINSAVGNAHFSAIGLDHKYEIVAGCFSRNKEMNKHSGLQYGVNERRIYDDLANLLRNEHGKIDAIVILTPTDQHASQVIDCIENEIPVICEKALATKSVHAHEIKKALDRKSGFLKVIYNYLGYPILRELKYLIESNQLGKINHIQVEMPQEGFIRVAADGNPIVPQSWRLNDDMISTISLDLGVHLHMLIKYLIGEIPKKVVSISRSQGNFPQIFDNVSSIIEYSNNITCNMWFSKIAIGRRNGMAIKIYGQKGSAEWVQENPEYLSLADNKGQKWTIDRGCDGMKICSQVRYSRFKAGHPAGFIEGYANYYYDIADSLEAYLKKESNANINCFGVDESLEGLYLFEAISRSNKSNIWENI